MAWSTRAEFFHQLIVLPTKGILYYMEKVTAAFVEHPVAERRDNVTVHLQ